MGASVEDFARGGSVETRVWSRELGFHVAFWSSEARKRLFISRLNVAARCCRAHTCFCVLDSQISLTAFERVNE